MSCIGSSQPFFLTDPEARFVSNTVGYTRAQLDAIRSEAENLHIIAGAGSGKTQVVAERIVRLLEHQKAEPRNIVAFTFTEKAAAELAARVLTVAGERLGPVVGMAEMFIGTMHGYSLRILQDHLLKYLKFSVLTDVQRRLFIDRNSNRSGLTTVTVKHGNNKGQTLRRYVDTYLFAQALDVLREDNLLTTPPKDLEVALGSYRELLEDHRYLDFSEILVAAVEALEGSQSEDEPLRSHVRDQVRYVVVDEYQDVNPIQERLIRSLSRLGAGICVVGDDDQTIYQWRGSDVQQILTFSNRYPNTETVTLDDNFRSTPAIVRIGAVIAEANLSRLPKALRAAGHQKHERGDVLALEFASETHEAEWVADRILELRGTPFQDHKDSEGRGLDWSDFAILLRSVKRSSAPIITALKQRSIPYVVAGMANLFDAAEVQAARLLYEHVSGRTDSEAVRAAWISADLGLSGVELDAGIEFLAKEADWDERGQWAAYNLQRTLLGFLTKVNLREEKVPTLPDGSLRGEIVMYNLGRFSQAISDFEQIHFQSDPESKYNTFVEWLLHQASGIYEEGQNSAGFSEPNAVVVSTVHQAKGREWPAVFVPALQRNRFPASVVGGRNIWHLMPESTVARPERYRGSEEDERRLFYVAVTRAQKFLTCSWAPGELNRYRRASDFFVQVTRTHDCLTRPTGQESNRIHPRARIQEPELVLSFSQLKYLLECPYQFKLRFLYGFNSPLDAALGYGKSIHDALAEVHRRALNGDIAGTDEVEAIVNRHLNVPFARGSLERDLRLAAERAVTKYLKDQGAGLSDTIHAEKEIRVDEASGVTIVGRIDLVRKLETDELAIVDFKSSERAQAEDITRSQLHIYAVGYRQLTGRTADVVEVMNLDPNGSNTREQVEPAMLAGIIERVQEAGEALRRNELPRLEAWGSTCERCDLRGICRDSP